MRFDWVQVRIDVKLLLTWLNYGSGFQQSSSGDVRHHFPFTFAEEHHNITVDWMLLDDVMSHTHTHTLPGVVRLKSAKPLLPLPMLIASLRITCEGTCRRHS